MRVYKPLGKRVVIEVLPFEEKRTATGIITETADHTGFAAQKLRGKVILCGSKVDDVKVDDIVVFEIGAPVPLSVNNLDLVWMEEDQIVAIEVEKAD